MPFLPPNQVKDAVKICKAALLGNDQTSLLEKHITLHAHPCTTQLFTYLLTDSVSCPRRHAHIGVFTVRNDSAKHHILARGDPGVGPITP